MRANTKKLLSALVVLAMVLSMVPVVGLPAIEANAAVALQTKDITAAAQALQDGFAQGVTTGTTCPACNRSNITWEPLTEADLGKELSGDAQKHYYLAGDKTFDVATLFTMYTSNLCLHLNGKTMTTSGQIKANSNSVLAIMGQGTVQYTGTASFIDSANHISVYGGTYNATNGGNLMHLKLQGWAKYVYGSSTFNGPVIIENANTNTVFGISNSATFTDLMVKGGAKALIYEGWSGTIYKISSDGRDLTNSGVLNLSGAFTGQIFNEDGYRLIKGTGESAIIDPDYTPSNPGGGEGGETPDPETPTLPTTCPACSATNVTWEALPAEGATVGPDTTKHYYLASDMTFDGTTLLTVANSTSKLCLHLNGHTLTTSGNIYSNASGSQINLMGDTGIVNYNGTGTFVDTIGKINVYGGTYNATNGGNLMHLKLQGWVKYVYGSSTFNGPVIIENANTNTAFVINDSATFTDLTVKGGAKAVIIAGWSGTISKFSSDGRDELTTAVLTITGTISGNIYNDEGYRLIKGTGESAIIDPNYTPANAAKIGTTEYATAQLAVNAAQAGDVVVLLANATIDTTGKTVTVDAAGHDVTVNGTGTLYAIDSTNDTYDATKCGTWTISNVTKWEAEANGGKYVLIAEATAGTYTAHRLDIRISAVNLRTTQAGLYYTAEYKCDDVLLGKVESYGVALSLGEIPTDLVNSAFTSISTAFEANNDHTYSTYSGAVVNILTEGGEQNAANAIKAVKANAYLEINTGANEPVVVMGIADSDDSAEYSLADVLDTVNTGWNATWMTEGAKTLVAQFYKKWSAVFEAVTGYNFAAIAEKASSL